MSKNESHPISAGDWVTVIGFGVEGQSAVDYVLKQHVRQIDVFDEKEPASFNLKTIGTYKKQGVIFHFQTRPLRDDLTDTDWVIRSPGVNPKAIYLEDVIPQSKVTSTTGIFLDAFPRERIIGVTGTKGKGTTSTLITEMLMRNGVDAHLGGNIGVPPLTFLEKLTPQSRVVLEMSSFQLLDLTRSPHIAVVLMTTVEHLNWHASEEEYVLAKANMVTHQKKRDIAIVNRDYDNSRRIGEMAPSRVYWISTKESVERGCFVEEGFLVFADGKKQEQILPVDEILIPGKHNWENAAAAAAAAKLAGVSTAAIADVLRTFKGLEHRLELVGEVRGVRYFNDSFSTVPETAIAAINAFDEPKVLLLGGSTKHSDFTELGNVIAGDRQIKAIIAIGPEWLRIKAAIGNRRPDIAYRETCTTMEEAVAEAYRIAQPGYVVVETPACASFAWHPNYKERGKLFKKAVSKLGAKK